VLALRVWVRDAGRGVLGVSGSEIRSEGPVGDRDEFVQVGVRFGGAQVRGRGEGVE